METSIEAVQTMETTATATGRSAHLKRRLSAASPLGLDVDLGLDAPDADSVGEPAAKRARPDADTGLAEAGAPALGPAETGELELAAPSAARDRKKRKRRKRKQSVVVDAAQKAAADGVAVHDAAMGGAAQDTADAAPSVPAPAHAERPTSPPAQDSMRESPLAKDTTDLPPLQDANPARVDKGKARALSPAPTAEPESEAQAEAQAGPSNPSKPSPAPTVADASSESQSLTAHQALLGTLLPALTCQICLLLMHRPFALAPCGHVACHACLTSWFKGGADANANADQGAQDANANANPNINANAGAHAEAHNNAPARPPRPAPPPRLRKTCPHCRAPVRARPAEVWSIKEMARAVAQSGLADPESVPVELRPSSSSHPPAPAAAAADPWHGLFPPDPPARPHALPYAEDYLDWADDASDSDDALPAWLTLRAGFARGPGRVRVDQEEDDDDDDITQTGMRDDEDGGVYRCVSCMHEIWDGECSHCGRHYPGHAAARARTRSAHFLELFPGMGRGGREGREGPDGDEDDGGSDSSVSEGEAAAMDAASALMLADIGRRLRGARAPQWHVEEDDEDEDGGSEDGEYEGSFIDDGNGDGSGVSDDEIIELPAPPRHRAAPIVIDVSDDEVEAHDAPPLPPNRVRGRLARGVTRVFSDDEDGEGEDEDEATDRGDDNDDVGDLAARVAAREREMYGDDGSVPARPRRYPRPAMDYEDEDEEDEDGDDGEYDSAASEEYEARNPYLARLDRPWQFMDEENEDDYDHGEDDEGDWY